MGETQNYEEKCCLLCADNLLLHLPSCQASCVLVPRQTLTHWNKSWALLYNPWQTSPDVKLCCQIN